MKPKLELNRSLALALGLLTIGGLGYGLSNLNAGRELLPSDVFFTVLLLGFMVLAPLCSGGSDLGAEDGAGPTAAPGELPSRNFTEMNTAAFRDGLCCLNSRPASGHSPKRCCSSCAARVGGAIFKRTAHW